MDDLIIPEKNDIKEGENAPKEVAKAIMLKPLDESFAQYYAKSGNGVESYAMSHDLDISNPLIYGRAATMAGRKLKNVEIVARINQLLNLNDFNDESMDSQLNFLAHQHTDLKTKLGAIKEYNALKGRTGKSNNVFNGNTFNLVQALRQANQGQ